MFRIIHVQIEYFRKSLEVAFPKDFDGFVRGAFCGLFSARFQLRVPPIIGEVCPKNHVRSLILTRIIPIEATFRNGYYMHVMMFIEGECYIFQCFQPSSKVAFEDVLALIVDIVPGGSEFIDNDYPPWRAGRHSNINWAKEWSVLYVYPSDFLLIFDLSVRSVYIRL